MSLPIDFENEVRKEWLIKVSHWNSEKTEKLTYVLFLHNRKGVRRCVRSSDIAKQFIGKPSQYIMNYLNNRYKFRELAIEVVSVRIIYDDPKIGDKVKTDNWGGKLDNKVHTITDIKTGQNCQSGTMVLIDGYDDYLDSHWLIKV